MAWSVIWLGKDRKYIIHYGEVRLSGIPVFLTFPNYCITPQTHYTTPCYCSARDTYRLYCTVQLTWHTDTQSDSSIYNIMTSSYTWIAWCARVMAASIQCVLSTANCGAVYKLWLTFDSNSIRCSYCMSLYKITLLSFKLSTQSSLYIGIEHDLSTVPQIEIVLYMYIV